MVRTVSLWVFTLAMSVMWIAPLAAQDDAIRNADGKVGSASLDFASGWTRNTAYWRGPDRDNSGVIWEGQKMWLLNARWTLVTEWDYFKQLGQNNNSLLAGFKYYTQEIGSGVAMNPDGVVGSLVLAFKAGYHRVDGYHGGRIDAGINWPLKPQVSWTLDGSWNRTSWDNLGIDQLQDVSLTSGFNLYSAILTYDDENSNPDGVLGSLGLSVFGGMRRRGDDNGGIAGLVFQIPTYTWLTPYIEYTFENIDDVLTMGPETDSTTQLNDPIKHERNSIINQLRIGLKIY